MSKLTLTALASAALLALAACETPTSPTAGPGLTPTPPATAASFFSQVCVANRANLSQGPQTIAQMAFILNTSEGRYYHRTFDLSFRFAPVGQGQVACEMGWRNNEAFTTNRQAVWSVAPDAFVPIDESINFLFASILGNG